MENSKQSAFPVISEEKDKYDSPFDDIKSYGLTKRELFAAMAMQGILAGGSNERSTMIVQAAIVCADDFLTQLNNETNGKQNRL